MSQLESRRCNIEITEDVLRLGQADKSKIRHVVNITYCQSDKYLSILSELKLPNMAVLSNQLVIY